MKIAFYGFCIVTLVCGVALYPIADHPPSRFVASDSPSNHSDSTQDKRNISTPSPDSATRGNTGNLTRSTTPPEKKCTCCSKTSLHIKEIVKQKRQELELWARDTIVNYGYEDGMKRITAKSPALAQRIQRLLEQEQEQEASQTSQRSIR